MNDTINQMSCRSIVETRQFLRVFENVFSCTSLNWDDRYANLFQQEHLFTLKKEIANYLKIRRFNKPQFPVFEEEVSPPLADMKMFFDHVLLIIVKEEFENESALINWVSNAIKKAPFEYFLILLGQRFTSASEKSHLAIPPLLATLLKSSFKPYNKEINMATRAWEKHVGRSKDDFWGIVEGGSQQKESNVRVLMSKMIKEKTWWNIFCHYKHGLVYEVRTPSGHGVRWNREGTELIGFLEPFL